LLTLQFSIPQSDVQQIANLLAQLQQNIRNLPGVKAVAAADGLPFGSANYPGFRIEGRPDPDNKGSGLRYKVSHDYFQTLGVELIKGRIFTAEDTRDSPPVIVINDVLAQRYFPNEDPLGKRLQETPTSPSLEIIGIVRHVEHYKLDGQDSAQPQFYTSFNQRPNSRVNLLVRTEVEPLSLTSAIRAQIVALNKEQAVFNVRTMEQSIAQSIATRRFSMLLLVVFALVALALASLGIYGLLSYTVTQRAREIGVRMALGAQRRDVLKLVIGQGMKLTLAGVALGLVASVALTRTMKNLLFGVSPTDPVTLVAIALLLTVVALLACWNPARRATRVDPVVTLRHE
jgi:putative ABC transport system permease protein